jgi:hypothetical protein
LIKRVWPQIQQGTAQRRRDAPRAEGSIHHQLRHPADDLALSEGRVREPHGEGVPDQSSIDGFGGREEAAGLVEQELSPERPG